MNIQSGILLEHCKAGIFLEADIKDLSLIAGACRTFCQKLEELQQQFPEARLGATVAFGERVWKQLAPHSAPELKPFTTLGKGNLSAPATQQDLLIHIQSMRPDVNFSLALAVNHAFADALEIGQEIHGFRWVEERDLLGFIDGTENPKGDEKRLSIGVIAEGEDQGGSYVFTQRYEHQLNKWAKLNDEKQEQVFGRTKKDSEELEDVPATSHVGRTDLKENGKGLKIIRQSLPYGTATGTHGLFFIAYCATLHNIEQQLLSMFGELDGKTDRMLGFTKAVTGSYYFAPSLDKLKNL